MTLLSPPDMDFFLHSVNRPQGIFEIYKPGEIGNRSSCRVPFLESCRKAEDIKEYGLAFQYGIHSDNVRLQLWTTIYSDGPPIKRNKEGIVAGSYQLIHRVDMMAFFSYRPVEVSRIGQGILQGEILGPLEHAVFQEILRHDKQPKEIQAKVGQSFNSLGAIACAMQERELSID